MFDLLLHKFKLNSNRIWICPQIKTMRALSATPTWVMNWQLFLNNPNADKWQRHRVKKSKLSAKQKYKNLGTWQILSALCGTNLSLGQTRNPSIIVQQRANVANICLCYHKCISMWLPHWASWYLRQKGQTTNNWPQITRNFEAENESLSLREHSLKYFYVFEILYFCIFVQIRLDCGAL